MLYNAGIDMSNIISFKRALERYGIAFQDFIYTRRVASKYCVSLIIIIICFFPASGTLFPGAFRNYE